MPSAGHPHSRPITYRTEGVYDAESPKFEIGKQYAEVHKYLSEKKLFSDADFFNNGVADHFAGLIKPYMESVIPLLDPNFSFTIKVQMAMAYNTTVKK